MLRGMVRRGSWTSWPTIDEISKPENAKHIADHRLIVVHKSSRGINSDGANDVALPKVANAMAPLPISMAAGIHVATLPACCTHLPAEKPMMLISVQNHSRPSTNVTE